MLPVSWDFTFTRWLAALDDFRISPRWQSKQPNVTTSPDTAFELSQSAYEAAIATTEKSQTASL